MNISSVSSNLFQKLITLQWLPKSDTSSFRQLRKDIKDLSDRQDKTTEALERIEASLTEQTQVINFIAQHLINQDNY